ncbi:hypothetical protein DB42_AK00530 [Neochlamydia sp. EPS4]|nr:hypothetical protein DB42_AK00530 [Neochlamydia sp. EPS4]
MEDIKLTDTAFEKYSRYGISLFDPHGYLLPNDTLGCETENAWFDISRKIDFCRWKVSNRRNESSLSFRKRVGYKKKTPEIFSFLKMSPGICR